jgi:hypothetical protein
VKVTRLCMPLQPAKFGLCICISNRKVVFRLKVSITEKLRGELNTTQFWKVRVEKVKEVEEFKVTALPTQAKEFKE